MFAGSSAPDADKKQEETTDAPSAKSARARNQRSCCVRNRLITVLCAGAAALCMTLATAAPQQKDEAPGKKAAEKGREKRKGPPGPVPRLADGKPDLTGMWNAFGSVGKEEKAPNMLPWAEEVVARHIANDSAEDFEARCLPGALPGRLPTSTSSSRPPSWWCSCPRATPTCIASSS